MGSLSGKISLSLCPLRYRSTVFAKDICRQQEEVDCVFDPKNFNMQDAGKIPSL